jgi:two-component system CheB/CheR fusion protein
MAAPKNNETQPPATVQNFPIVGIGASAGGLDAFRRLLAVISENSGMAYVLVQHLDPTHESFLPEILQRVTKIPVHEITDDIHLAPNHIYIIPENKILTSTDGILQLAPRNREILNLSIDIFFKSLAEVHQEFAVGIVLSGTGSDGTLGLKAIKEHGGIGFAQDMESAAYNSMPQSAINAGVVDFILSPEEIPEQLLKINRTYKTSHIFKDFEQFPKDDEDIFKKILSLLHKRSGVDFSFYKRPTFYRRISRRIAMVNKNNMKEYLKFLNSNVAEQDALFEDVLIPVTSFFRDSQTFQTLTETVFPAIFKDKPEGESFRCWIAGCSTGEEAYSIAISLHEFLTKNPESSNELTKIQIFASDISEKVIKKARSGIYTKADLQPLSAAQIKKYFTKHSEGYEICKLIRDMCVIAPHNFLKDPPFAKMDLISCRNVLIYMDTFLQKKAFATFHYALKENGFLLLGKSETIGTSSDLFTQVKKNEKIYSRKQAQGRFTRIASERKEEGMTTKDETVNKTEATQTDFRKSAEEIMLSKSPASVVVNEHLDIVHIHGDISPFLKVPQGKPTFNLLKMAREGLGFELRNAIHKANKREIAVTKENIPIKINALIDELGENQEERGKKSLVTIEIIPLTDTVEPHYLIRFEKIVIPLQQEDNLSPARKIKNDLAEKRNELLDKELAHVREDMRSITEDMDASNEELQSANEELQSSNEEMQSLNEELETSKEELQSTNEELIIVNQELLDKQDQLNSAIYYAESIVSTIREPLIILDKTLKIKTANASFYKVFNAEEEETEGKLFYEIQNHQWDDEVMRSLLEKILPEKQRLTDFEIILNFPFMGKRTLLLNALQILNKKNAEKLILLAIEDISERKLAEQKLQSFSDDLETQVIERTAELKKSIEELKQTNIKLDQFVYVASHDLQEPLRKILTYSMRLQDKHKGELSEDVKLYLNKIESSASRMTTLIQDLLTFSRLLNHEDLYVTADLNEIVKNVLNDFELLIQEKNAEIKIDKLPSIDAISLQMNQLFYNIIGNALKFSKEKIPPIIEISSRILSKDEIEKYPNLNPLTKYFEVIIKDNGIGFEQKYAKQIFTIFQRLHDKESYMGTGVGLALCNKIVENHHGEIFSIATEKKGAYFHVILPLHQP